ncbi:hypothetical protein GZ77_12865 [Endozoicomonas montiporae]|uniref:Uncharacterized protein n=2 Tax=Endozoicomonas montiporae TaxID=1027273 RepID=A0A081N4E2_9GAMM|nr:hypothetical protein [Endozoicomonas montiporae]AMO57838.1 hypothetical protein EZMO1_3897 [Endozoicomonas montiporae CL-33]KEQ13315.1 hypothetical protein GZ77_12865 [Endozoicomonas montiporae]
MAGKIDNNSGITPPIQPESTPQTEPPVGKLGSKTVSPHSLDENLQQGLQSRAQPDKEITDRSVSRPPLSKEKLDLVRDLIRNKSWGGVQNVLNEDVKSLEHFDQLAEIAPRKLPLEAQQLVVNRYAEVAAERIHAQLTDLKGSASEQLDSLNLYFIRPDSPHNAVKIICRSVSNDFMQASKFQPSLEQSLRDQMETHSFKLLKRSVKILDEQVATEGSPEQKRKNLWQINQRLIEVGG